MIKRQKQTDPALEQVLSIGRNVIKGHTVHPIPETIRIKGRTVEDTKFAFTVGLLATYTIINIVTYKKSGHHAEYGHHDNNLWSFLGSYNGRLAIQGLTQAVKVALSK